MAKKFKKIVAPRISVDTDDLTPKEIVAACNRALSDMAVRCNKAIETLVKPLNSNLPLWATGELITIDVDDDINAGVDFWIRHNLGVTPRFYRILNGYPKNTYNNADTAWGLATTRGFIDRSPTAWSKSRVCFQVNVHAVRFQYRFTVLLIP